MENRFVLLTAAKNEGKYIGATIESVLRQTVRPLAWFVMDDGSTDETAQIVARYAAEHAFIHLHSVRRGGARNFGSQYRAINAAFERARELQFDFIGTHDADIALKDEDYYERVLGAMDEDTRLGITGGYVHERSVSGAWEGRKANSPDAVAGGVQMFRRACYEQIGGYTPLLFGGEDWLAQLDAKVAGWSVRALLDLPVHHHRPTSSAGGRLRGLFRLGMMDGSFGSHPVFELLKCARRVGEHPLLLGCVVRFAGYLWYRATMRAPLLPAEKVAHLRHEQVRKIHDLIRFVSPTQQGPS